MRPEPRPFAWALLCVLWSLFGCPRPAQELNARDVVVELAPLEAAAPAEEPPSLYIYADEYRAQLARKRLEQTDSNHAPPLSPAMSAQVLERMIEDRLVAQEAERLGVKASTVAVAAELEALRAGLPEGALEQELVRTYQNEEDLKRTISARLVRAKLLGRHLDSVKRPTETELQLAFERMPKEEKIRPERVRAAQIVVASEKEGEKLLFELLHKKLDFAEAARARSIAPEGAKGGDLGWFQRGVMPRFFDEVCFSLKPGQISSPTPSNYGFHIFKVLEQEPARPLRFEEARAELEQELMTTRLREAEEEYLETLRSKVRVIRHEALILGRKEAHR